jgi:deoxyribonuclease-4
MWRYGALDHAAIQRLNEARQRLDLTPLVVHDNYLINLAAGDPSLRARSIAAFRAEIERCMAMDADYLVLHPGSYRGQRLEEGIETLAASLIEAAAGLASSAIGSRFEELAEIRRAAAGRTGFRIGYCLDTAHCLASGFDVASASGLEKTVRAAGRILGLSRVKVIHTNDSKAPLGSRVDRHEHIGQGYIGMQGFRRILNHPGLWDKAFILETPIDREGDDRRNLLTLKRLCRKSRTTKSRSS